MEAPPRRTDGGGPVPFVAMLAGNLCLAFGPWMVRLTDVGPVAAGFWRLAIAAPILVFFALRAAPVPRLPRSVWGLLIVAGVLFAADLATWHAGIHRTRLANATLFGNISAFLFPLYGFIIARRLPNRVQGLALGLAFAGMMLLLGRSYELSSRTLAGDLFCMLAGVFYAGYLIVVERGRTMLGAWQTLAVATLAGIAPLLIVAMATGEQVWPSDFTPLVLLALGSQVAGQGLTIYAIGKLSPLVIGLGALLQPVVAAAVGAALYGERLTTADLFGAAAVATALVLVRIGR
ncbi:DMT family transporter [Sphingomonas sp. XMGL2]|uniref:DMT family transporter n=2 Tax=Sphingomonas quercus TaxID=2842451 RepID=A0ABS6BGR9_9SPHN|nr:DMT family transporter [Sphingomonas quercus]